MKLRHFLFLGLAAWAGMTAFRAQMLLAPLLPKDRDLLPNRSGFDYEGNSGGGGIGAVGGGIGAIGGVESFFNRAPSHSSEAELLKAAANGDIKHLKTLLARSPDLDTRDAQQHTALMLAAAGGRSWACEALLSAGADITAEDADGFTALDYAAGAGQTETLQAMLTRAKLHDRDRHYEYAALMKAAYTGDASELPAGKLGTLDRLSAEDQSPLMVAAGNGGEAMVRLFLQRGANVNLRNKGGQTALHWAAWNNQPRIVSLLLQSGAEKDAVDGEGNSALSMSRSRGYAQVSALLQ